jgi:integrase
MARPIEVLNDKTIRELDKPGLYADGDALYLRVSKSLTKAWVYRYWENGRRFAIGLGPYPKRTIKSAREVALRYSAARLDNLPIVSPTAQRRAKATPAAVKRLTFRQAAEQWLEKMEPEWTPGNYADVVSSLRAHAYDVIGTMPIADIDQAAVLKVIGPKWGRETLSRVRNRIEKIIDFAVVAGHRPPGDNPARWATHLEHLLAKKSKLTPAKRHAKLAWEDMPAFMTKLRAYEGSKPLTAKALELCILTATRASGAIGARWSEINFKGRLWVIPAERMKMRVALRVPLSDAALTLLGSLPTLTASNQREDDLVFGKLVNNSLIRLLDTFGINDAEGRKLTVHGFRGTFATWVTGNPERKYSYEVKETALAHEVGNEVERRYDTADLLDERRPLMEHWAAHCEGRPLADNVTVLRRA